MCGAHGDAYVMIRHMRVNPMNIYKLAIVSFCVAVGLFLVIKFLPFI